MMQKTMLRMRCTARAAIIKITITLTIESASIGFPWNSLRPPVVLFEELTSSSLLSSLSPGIMPYRMPHDEAPVRDQIAVVLGMTDTALAAAILEMTTVPAVAAVTMLKGKGTAP
jgi:hypothetical protein